MPLPVLGEAQPFLAARRLASRAAGYGREFVGVLTALRRSSSFVVAAAVVMAAELARWRIRAVPPRHAEATEVPAITGPRDAM